MGNENKDYKHRGSFKYWESYPSLTDRLENFVLKKWDEPMQTKQNPLKKNYNDKGIYL